MKKLLTLLFVYPKLLSELAKRNDFFQKNVGNERK